MSSDNIIPGLIRTYFWMVHYDFPQDAETKAGLKPIKAGKERGVAVIHRNIYGRHTVGFNMPREAENSPDPAHYRGPGQMRNRIVGFYATPEEANAHMNEKLWADLRKIGAVYAELHGMKLDVAGTQTETMRLVA
jgi:hypothetical protein